MTLSDNLKKLKNPLIAVLVFSSSSAFAVGTDNPLYQILQQETDGNWAQLNQNSFGSVATPPEYRLTDVAGTGYGNSIGNILTAWSGFAWDSNHHQLIIYGGGHANYPGNDVYTWNSSNLDWQRASLPTQLTKVQYTDSLGNPYDFYYTIDNGASPQSAHTYGNNVFLPTLDRFLTFGGFVFTTTFGTTYFKQGAAGEPQTTGPYLFNPNLANPNQVGGATGTGVDPNTTGGNMWQNRDIYANSAINSKLPLGFGTGTASVVNENGKDVVYVVAPSPSSYGDNLYKYIINDINDPSKDSWSIVGSPDQTTFAFQGMGAVDTDLNIFVRTGGRNIPGGYGDHEFFFWDLSKAGTQNLAQSFNVTDSTGGLFRFDMLGSYGMDYNPLDKNFYLWGGGNTVFVLSHTSGYGLTEGWVLSIDSVLGSSAPGANAVDAFPKDGGILGKWHYASDFKAFIGLETNGNVWVYKPVDYSLTSVPLPGAFWLFGSVITALGLMKHRKNQ